MANCLPSPFASEASTVTCGILVREPTDARLTCGTSDLSSITSNLASDVMDERRRAGSGACRRDGFGGVATDDLREGEGFADFGFNTLLMAFITEAITRGHN